MSRGYETKTIEHLGLVSGMVDELGVAELIDEVIEQDFEQRQVTVGQAVKAMILNGLGFANRRLYLSPHFFENKPTEQLIGRGVSAEVLNDDTLGKALDKLHSYGVSELYSLVAARAVKRLGLSAKVGHQDISSFHVDGVYNSEQDEAEPGLVPIRRGYSRDGHPELNQVTLELIQEHQASLPVAMQVLGGNQNDSKTMQASVQTRIEQLRQVGIGVLEDSAGYSETALQTHEAAELTWIMRVPAKLKEVKTLLETTDLSSLQPLMEGYQYMPVSRHYTDTLQRWLLIHSQAETRARKTMRKQLKQSEKEQQAFAKLCRQDFACQADAQAALQAFQDNLKVLSVHEPEVKEQFPYTKPGRPAKDQPADRVSYQLQAYLAAPLDLYQAQVTRAALFVLATNEPDPEQLRDQEILLTYKAQSSSERGFRFLKDPMFLASTLFLKKVQRIMALLMVMTLCLLV